MPPSCRVNYSPRSARRALAVIHYVAKSGGKGPHRMKSFGTVLLALISLYYGIRAQDLSLRVWEMERKGDAVGARDLLQREAQSSSATVAVLRAYAEFLDRHHDPATRESYEKLLSAATRGDRAPVARRLAVLDMLAGDSEAARKLLEEYRAEGGKDALLPESASAKASVPNQTIPIP